MKLLRRALLIKWHYIEHELIEFAPVTFLTGKNAAGKSTILDALQLVLLGDTTGHYFNKAANDNSKRTLKGYLRGEIAEDKGGDVINLRDGQFSSYIVLEFAEERDRKPFCMGVVFDCSPDGSYEWRFFSLAESIPDFHFIRDGVPLDIKALRAWGLTRKNRFEMFESNKRYQEVFRARMGNLNEKFFRLFRKAVPFSPIMDIAGFISEFVCDVKVQLDIDDMRENIRHYRRMEEELHVVEARVGALGEMDATYHGMEAAREKVQLYEYLLDEAELTGKEQRVEKLTEQLARCDARSTDLDDKIRAHTDNQDRLRTQRDALLEERANSDVYQRQQQLDNQVRLMESQFGHIRTDGERQDRFLDDGRARWRAVSHALEDTDTWWTNLSEAGVGGTNTSGTNAADVMASGAGVSGVAASSAAALESASGVPESRLVQSAPLYSQAIRAIRDGMADWPKSVGWKTRRLLDSELPQAANPDTLRKSAAFLQQASQLLQEGHHLMRDAVSAWTGESSELERAIHELRQGIKQYDPRVITLKNVLEKEFAAAEQTASGQPAGTLAAAGQVSQADHPAHGKSGQAAPVAGHAASAQASDVSIFAELLDVRNPEWQKAIEGYLHTQRFYLLVPPEVYGQAVRIYDEAKQAHHLYDVGIVDVAKVVAEKPKVQPGSLAEEIVTDNPYARTYADYLLGHVMKCNHVDELRNHRTGITKDGMLYQNYVVRRINPARWATLYIGKRAIAQQLEQKTARLAQVQGFLGAFKPRLAAVAEWAAQPVPSTSELSMAEEFLESVKDLGKLRADYKAIIDEMGRLDLTRLDQIKGEITRCDAALRDVDQQIRKLTSERGMVEGQRDRLMKLDIPAAEAEARDKKLQIASRYDAVYAADMHPRYEQELQRLGSPETITANFGRTLSTERNRVTDSWNDLVRQREAYNRSFGAGFDIQREDNDPYQAELTGLRDTHLTEYGTQIKEAKERAQIQFQEDFINKLRSNIDTVEQQIKELNYALREVSFGGRERYQFKVSPNAQYEPFYRMIMDDLLLEGRSLFSQAFMEKHGAIIEELFRHIVDVDEQDPAVQVELERNLHKFTDYRTYIDFDLIVKDEEGRESRLSRVIAKRSGGETQTPFYIAVLASFAQTYRVNQPGFDNTLRLMMFDEAYSKMDHQRIRDSIKLVRDMKLQVILSAPTEKIADIVPLVDKTIVVQRIKSETRVAPFNPEPFDAAPTGVR